MKTEKDPIILRIAKRVATALKLNDEGRINNFYKKEIKILESCIGDLKHNEITVQRTYERKLEKLEEKLEDAVTAYEEAFEEIDVEAIKTNDGCEKFSEIFWKNIKRREDHMLAIKSEIETFEKNRNDKVKDAKEQIEKYQERINKLNQ